MFMPTTIPFGFQKLGNFSCVIAHHRDVSGSRTEHLLEYWTEHVTIGLLCVTFILSIRIFYRRVPGFVTDCLCSVWCRGLTTCLLYAGPLF